MSLAARVHRAVGIVFVAAITASTAALVAGIAIAARRNRGH
jgi:hypothetical protein